MPAIKMRKLFAILLSCLPLVLWAAPTSGEDIDCGTKVKVTATPKPGYHFEQWSDGNTDNPRWIDVQADSAITAIFAPDCQLPVVPVEALYDWMLVVNKPELNKMGFAPAENEVNWYRVVNKIDERGDEKRDDELVHVGYYLTVTHAGSADDFYYAEIQVDAPESYVLCSDTLRSTTWKFDGTQALYRLSGTTFACNYTDGKVRITGLPPGETVGITLYDPIGRCILRTSTKEPEFDFDAPPVGCYIIQISTRAGTFGIRYIQQ